MWEKGKELILSATNQTSFLGLSSWLGTDKPQRTDFNSDNEKIDNFASEHTADLKSHLSAEDREKFDQPYFMGVYFGNGKENQTIVTSCPFKPSFGFAYCLNEPWQETDFTNKASYSYAAFMATRGSMPGISISGSDLVVSNTITAVSGTEYSNMNSNGRTYFYVLFR